MSFKGEGFLQSGGEGDFKKIYVGIKPSITQATQSSEAVLVADPMEDVQWEETKEFKLATPTSLKNDIEISKDLHLRPLSDREYSQLLDILKSQRDSKGNQLFKHDLAAIARVVQENFRKFFPSTEVDYQVSSALEFHFEVDDILKSLYEETLNNYRNPLILTKAEEVENLYTPDEIQRLRGLGITFLDEKYKNFDAIRTMVPQTTTTEKSAPVKIPQSKIAHPMLQYNLLKRK